MGLGVYRNSMARVEMMLLVLSSHYGQVKVIYDRLNVVVIDAKIYLI